MSDSARRPVHFQALPIARVLPVVFWRGWRVMLLFMPVLVSATLLTGCGQSQGELLFMMGLGRGPKVEAKVRLTDGPLLILVDDPNERVRSPKTMRGFFDDLAQALLKNKAAKKIIPRETLDHLRQSTPGFERRGCDAVGRLAGAEQVLWIEVEDFVAREQVEDATQAAYLSVTVKLINPNEKERRSRVRLWPVSPNGHPVTVSLTASEAQMEKTAEGIAKKLVSDMAEAVARLFYDHRLNEFGR